MTLLRRITIATFLLFAAAFTVAAQSPRGEMLKLQISDSGTYPGTVRNVSVYVPQQYDGTRPACLFVRMDGLGHNIPQIFDELIDEGAMPVTIGVFITSGRIYDEKGEVVRYNRSNEFDRMTSTWVEFIENEVLPEVERLTTSDGRRIMLSKNPADRAINGDSSGGIASFTAAWTRPDLYSRVYCIVGTFVPMRGGDGYPALIRKYEPKPLRIFLQDNDNDSWNLTFGSWYEYNLLMASALRYSGYDVRTQWDEGGHSGTNGGRIMKDVLRWLWAGWPAPIEPRFGDNALINSLIIPGEGWRQVSKIEGNPSHEALYPGGSFIARPKPHTSAVCTYIIDDGEEKYVQEFYWLHSEGGSDDSDRWLAFDTEGWLYASSDLGIQICDQNGRVRGIISVPAGKLEKFSFKGDIIYIMVDGKAYARRIGHKAATKDSPRPASQGQG